MAVTITCFNDQVHKSRLCFDSSECNGVTESRHETAYHIAGDVRKHEESADDIDLDELDVDVEGIQTKYGGELKIIIC